MPSLNMQPKFVERRAEPRYETAEAAKAVFSAAESVDCTVLNISSQGAQLGLRSEIKLPRRFTLLLKKSGDRLDARLVWQLGIVAGVKFDWRPPLLERLVGLAPGKWRARLGAFHGQAAAPVREGI